MVKRPRSDAPALPADISDSASLEEERRRARSARFAVPCAVTSAFSAAPVRAASAAQPLPTGTSAAGALPRAPPACGGSIASYRSGSAATELGGGANGHSSGSAGGGAWFDAVNTLGAGAAAREVPPALTVSSLGQAVLGAGAVGGGWEPLPQRQRGHAKALSAVRGKDAMR